MAPERLKALLDSVARGQTSVEAALESLRWLPYESVEFARIDHHRALRKGFPEVVFCRGKTPEQVAEMVARLAPHGRVLATRASREQYESVRQRVPQAAYHEVAHVITVGEPPEPPDTAYGVVVSAGSADIPVAEEAALTVQMMGVAVKRLYDVGVAGLHRLLEHLPTLTAARAIVVVAGMEGALPSVVGGIVPCPVIGVPTSVGYGAHFEGLAPLLTMLNTCAPGVSVVNIDNGFGAGYCMALIVKG